MAQKSRSRTQEKLPSISAGGIDRTLITKADTQDLRDLYYQPMLHKLSDSLSPPSTLLIRDQAAEGSCVGHALSAAINIHLQGKYEHQDFRFDNSASPRMLYEMAKLHDEWDGTGYSGSSLRGGMKGFYHYGVCQEQVSPYISDQNNWSLTKIQADQARSVSLGAYYRLRPALLDYHAALNETGVIAVSAKVHSGWRNPADGKIEYSARTEGGHAFAIVGYDQYGFIVQNSWGESWGGFEEQPGLAHWSYEDWADSVMDAWVLRLSVSTPKSFGYIHGVPTRSQSGTDAKPGKWKPRSQDVLGHVIHFDDGNLITTGSYPTTFESLKETVKILVADANSDDRKYDHIIIFSHGGLTNSTSAAAYAAASRDGFKRNRIYPIYMIWETGFLNEFGDILGAMFDKSDERVAGLSDAKDWAIENLSRKLGTMFWREMKEGAVRAFASKAESREALKILLDVNTQIANPFKIHLAGHSAGANMTGSILNAWSAIQPNDDKIATCSLMAPACTMDYFGKRYLPALKAKTIGQLNQYNLSDHREREDNTGPYCKSLLYFVSNAFEEKKEMPILGMEKFSSDLKLSGNHELYYAGKQTATTDAHSHGGYGSDVNTLNHILASILEKKPSQNTLFRESEFAKL